MQEDNRIAKVEILIQQKRFADAEKIIADLLRNDAHNSHLISLLAEVNFQQDKFDEAISLINNAIGLSPDESYLYYIKSRISLQQNKISDAVEQIDKAIELDPYDADNFALLASIKLQKKLYVEALNNAESALAIDAENLLALNIRSTALNKLDRSEEAFQTIEGALREDPNNAYTHANYGWGLLEKGDHSKALIHFKESLSNDPNSDYAQAGLLEAIKASNPIYRIFLKYAFFMSNLTEKYQWAVIFGFYFGVKLLRGIARNSETLQPYLTPLIIALAIIAFSTWIITPISNLFLRFNKYGQLLLDKKEKLSSSYVAVSLCLCLIGFILYFIMSDEKMLTIAVFGFAMMLPLGTMFTPSQNKNALLIYTISLAVVGLLSIGLTFYTGELLNVFSTLFILGFMAFQWVANYLVIKESNY